MEQQPHHVPDAEVPINGTPLEQVTAYLRIAFTEADARGEAITVEDARAIATLLGPLVGPESAMARFAATGDAHPAAIHQECQQLTQRAVPVPDVLPWIQRLEQYLAA